MATVSRTEPGFPTTGAGRRGPVRHRLTVTDFYRMSDAGILGRGERLELIDGEIIDMSPIGVLHAALVNVLVPHCARNLGGSTFVSSQNPSDSTTRTSLSPTSRSSGREPTATPQAIPRPPMRCV